MPLTAYFFLRPKCKSSIILRLELSGIIPNLCFMANENRNNKNPENVDSEPSNEKWSKETVYNLWYAFLGVIIILLVHDLIVQAQTRDLSYNKFLSFLEQGKVESIKVGEQTIEGTLKKQVKGKTRFVTPRVSPELAEKFSKYDVKFRGTVRNKFLENLLSWLVPAIILIAIWFFFFRKFAARQGMGQMMQAGGDKSKIYVEKDTGVTFDDVAGVDEAKREVKEVIDFLQHSAEYSRLGATIPKGMLLVGPPGTGKTLMARAIAGEADVPFLSISGSEFIEMFVGVGAARVRDLFKKAKQDAPAIIFIDELDSLGKSRSGGGPGQGLHGEQEQTLNQLLEEMDGFDPKIGVVMIGATNQPEVLDPALLRSGRFDRKVAVDRPNKKGRLKILELYIDKIKSDENLETEKIAAMTAGFSGADIANLVNEAALQATRRRADKVEMQDFEAAFERQVAGLEKKNRPINEEERKIVAHHELGHALVSMALPGTEPVQKISIIPRGIGALGYTMQRPTEDRYLMSRSEMENRIAGLLGGRVAEDVVFGEVSTGASDDLVKATDLARSMVVNYGMHDEIGNMSLEDPRGGFLSGGQEGQNQPMPPKPKKYSDRTAETIDTAVREIIDRAYQRAEMILEENKSLLEESAKNLLDQETFEADDLKKIQDDLKLPEKIKNAA